MGPLGEIERGSFGSGEVILYIGKAKVSVATQIMFAWPWRWGYKEHVETRIAELKVVWGGRLFTCQGLKDSSCD